ncbi:MAG: aldo/keto reductase [Anaerolineae bacterium]|nr:aldo/keto reductase [Anaerolineae bacterium]
METRKIGSLNVSIVGLGCNNFGRRLDAAGTEWVINAALDAGINFFDTADVYGDGQSEELLGRVLGARRSQVIIATKFGHNMPNQGKGASPAYIQTAIEASLRRLGTDYIDLYQLHTPDSETPIAETLGKLDDLVKAGKIREIGSSNFSAEQIREAEGAVKPGGVRFVSLQNEYSLLKREDEKEVLPECDHLNIGYLPYFPLASGMLTGKYRQGQALPKGTRITNNPDPSRWLNDANWGKVEKLTQFAESKGHTILELAFSWLLARPIVASVIAGAMKPEQIQANAKAANWQLTPADLAEIDAILSA